MSDLLESLRAAGETDSTGRFTLDRQRAQLKMRDFQLVEPHRYVLNLIESAVAGGATAIELQTERHRLTFTARGHLLPPEFLDQPFLGLFLSQEERSVEPLREMAIGLNSLLALKPERVEVTSGACSIVLDADAAHQDVDTHGDSDTPTIVRVHRRSTFEAEIRAIKERADFCPIPITINDQRLETAPTARLAHRFRIHPFHGELHLTEPKETMQKVWVIKNGVWLTTIIRDIQAPAPSGYVHADHLLKNASSSDAVQDERWAALLAALDRAGEEVIEHLTTQPTGPGREHLLEAVLSYLPGTGPLQSALRRCKMFESTAGWMAIDSFLNEMTYVHDDLRWPGDPILILRTRHEVEVVTHLLGARARPHRTTASPTVSNAPQIIRDHALLATVTLDEAGMRGEVGVLGEGRAGLLIDTPDGTISGTLWLDQVPIRAHIAASFPVSLNLYASGGENSGWVVRAAVSAAWLKALNRACESIRPPHPLVPAVQSAIHAVMQFRYWVEPGPAAAIPSVAELIPYERVGPAVRTYPIYTDIEGAEVTLDDLAKEAESGLVCYLTERPDVKVAVPRRIFVIQHSHRTALRHWFSKAQWVHYGRELRELQTPGAEPIRWATAFDIEKTIEGTRVQMGLATGHEPLTHWLYLYTAAGSAPSNLIRYFRDGRFILAERLDLGYGPLLIHADRPDIERDPSNRRMLVAKPRDRCLEAVQKVVPEVVSRMVEAFDPADARAREFLIDYLASGPGDAPEAVYDVPLIRRVGGVALSVRQARAESPLAFIWDGWDVYWNTDDDVLLVRGREHPMLLRQLGAGALVHWKMVEARRRGQARFHRVVKGEPELNGNDYIVRHPLPPPLRGELGLLMRPRQANWPWQKRPRVLITFFIDERPIETVSIPMAAPAEVVVAAQGLRASRHYDAVERDEVYWRTLQSIETELDRALEAACLAQPPKPHSDLAHLVLQWAVHRGMSVHQLFDTPLGLSRIPLFEGGRTLRDVSGMSMQLGTLTWSPHQEPSNGTHLRLDPIEKAALDDMHFRLRRSRGAAPATTVPAAPPVAPAVPSNNPTAPPRLDDRQAFLRGFISMLKALPRRENYHLGDESLRNIAFDIIEGEHLVRIDSTGKRLLINTTHPQVLLVRHLAESEPQCMVYLASAIFTAANAFREDITDTDELAFMLDLAEWLATATTTR